LVTETNVVDINAHKNGQMRPHKSTQVDFIRQAN